MNSAGVSSGEETWSSFSESEAGHHVEDSFDNIGFTDISPDDNPAASKTSVSWIANWNMMLMKSISILAMQTLEVKRQCELPVRQIHRTDIVGSLTRYLGIVQLDPLPCDRTFSNLVLARDPLNFWARHRKGTWIWTLGKLVSLGVRRGREVPSRYTKHISSVIGAVKKCIKHLSSPNQ